LVGMQVNVTIGEFSRMTHLSVKTLQHYHRGRDCWNRSRWTRQPVTRYYTTGQVPTAQIIRRFRELDMPVEQLRTALATPDPLERNGLIQAHLQRSEQQLRQTQDAVSALRLLLAQPQALIPVAYRTGRARAGAVRDGVAERDVPVVDRDVRRTARRTRPARHPAGRPRTGRCGRPNCSRRDTGPQHCSYRPGAARRWWAGASRDAAGGRVGRPPTTASTTISTSPTGHWAPTSPSKRWAWLARCARPISTTGGRPLTRLRGRPRSAFRSSAPHCEGRQP
jgi:DNA-binding transcriptional MerR regulator